MFNILPVDAQNSQSGHTLSYLISPRLLLNLCVLLGENDPASASGVSIPAVLAQISFSIPKPCIFGHLSAADMKRYINYTTVSFVALGVLAAWVSWEFFDIVTYIIIAAIVAAILRAPVNYLAHLYIFGVRFPRPGAVAISYLGFLGIIGLFTLLFFPLFYDQLGELLSKGYEDVFNKLTRPLEAVEQLLLRYGLARKGEGAGFLTNQIKAALENLLTNHLSSQLLNDLLEITRNFFVGLLAVTFISYFLLHEQGLVRKSLVSLIPNEYFEVSIVAMMKVEKLLSNYLLGLFVQMLLVFSMDFIGLVLIGHEYAIMVAIFAALMHPMPFVGPLLGASFGILVGIAGADHLRTSEDYLEFAMTTASVFGVVSLLDNILLQPLIFSKSVKAHPLEIFLSVFVGAHLAGVIGMVLAIPSYTMLKVFVTEFYQGYQQYRTFRR